MICCHMDDICAFLRLVLTRGQNPVLFLESAVGYLGYEGTRRLWFERARCCQ